LFNLFQNGLDRLGRRRPGFSESEERYHELAIEAAGCDDFGDPSYRAGLRVLLDAYDRESKFTPFGRMMAEQQIIGLLASRLSAQRSLETEPWIAKLEIRRPIFILGLPRTGTTALHHVLGQDPGIQVLEYWLAAAPQPRPPRDQWARQPEYKKAERDLKTMYYLDPSLKAMHLMTADGPEECRHLLGQTFTDDTFDCNATIPSYSAWYEGCDMRPSYAQHRKLLRLIGSPSPDRRWVLKYPVHMRHLRSLFDTYPDACIVQTHRDPAKVIPSLCSLVAGWRAIYEYDSDRRAVAKSQIDLWADGLEHALEVRRERGSESFLDLEFAQIRANPVAAVKRIYEHFGIEMSPIAEQRLLAFRAENLPGKHGEHRYSIADFGLDDSLVRDRYAAYIEHFGVPSEAGG